MQARVQGIIAMSAIRFPRMMRPVIVVVLAASLACGLFSTAAVALDSPPFRIASETTAHHRDTSLIVAQVGSNSSAAAGSSERVPNYIVEQYKEYVTDLAAVGSQLWTVQTFYLSIISALIAVLALKEANRPARGYFGPVPIAVLMRKRHARCMIRKSGSRFSEKIMHH
jgi:hypothetical protein